MELTVEKTNGFCRRVEFENSDAVGFLVIDSFLGGGGTGGIRFGEGVTEQEVFDLAHEMSLKFAWLNIPRGGAKAGICCSENVGENAKARILKEFGDSISDLLKNGKYVPGMDLGVGPKELAAILAGAEIIQPEKTGTPEIDSNFFTSLTVFVALETLLQERKKRIQDMTFLVEGVGKVGRSLIQLIDQAGGKIVGVSTIEGAVVDQSGIDVSELMELSERYGDDLVSHVGGLTVIPPNELYYQPADVLVPGARTNSIEEESVQRIMSKYIVPIANAVASQSAEEMMHRLGISYLPGFVSNSGGIFCWYLAPLASDRRARLIRRGLGAKIKRLVREADRDDIAIATLARRQAEATALRMDSESCGTVWQRLIGFTRKIGPRRIGYIVLRRILGNDWARKDSVFCRLYFDSKYFS